MTTAEEWREQIANMIDDAPATFTYNGTDYIGTTGSRGDRKNLDDGGFLHAYDYWLVVGREKRTRVLNSADVVWTATFKTEPDVEEKVVIDGVEYRIEHKVIDEFGAGIQFSLVSAQ